MRDQQQSLVYKWEAKFVAPYDKNIVNYKDAQNIINYIWEKECLNYPPKLGMLAKQSHCLGEANRLVINLPEKTYTWVILHEISHSLTAKSDGYCNHHGALFMGIYIQLLNKHLKMDKFELMKSAEDFGLKVKLDAKPVFLD